MSAKPKPKPPKRRDMSAAEYDRYRSTMKQSAERTGRSYYGMFDPRDPDKRNPKTTIMVASGGTRKPRTRFELGPERTKKKEQAYGGLYKGTSPTDYSKPKGTRP